MSRLIRLLYVCAMPVCLVLAGCASPTSMIEGRSLLMDASFNPATQQIPSAEAIFAVSPEMRTYLKENPDFRNLARRLGDREGLIESLYSRRMLQLDYESSITRNASEAFAARSGNCLSLVIMTAAFAQELQLPVRFQSVYTEEFWSRSENLYFMAGHVNLTLGTPSRQGGAAISLIEPDLLLIDFVRPEALRGQRRIEIDQRMIVAMYYNNRAVENLEEGHVDTAYWWVRAAVLHEPRFMASFNTLAVIYRRHGDTEAADAALRAVLRREPDNIQSLSNLTLVLRDQKRFAEADQLQARMAELRPNPPFKFFDEGVEAMKAGQYAKARDLFKREIARSAYYHEFYFWLALADYALGNPRDASKHLAQAIENSPTRKTHDLYAAKLAWLEQHDKPKDPQPYVMPTMPRGTPNGSY